MHDHATSVAFLTTHLAFPVLAAVPRGGAAVGRRGAGAQVEGDLGPHHTQTVMILQSESTG